VFEPDVLFLQLTVLLEFLGNPKRQLL
jgi:hypothetical protein